MRKKEYPIRRFTIGRDWKNHWVLAEAPCTIWVLRIMPDGYCTIRSFEMYLLDVKHGRQGKAFYGAEELHESRKLRNWVNNI